MLICDLGLHREAQLWLDSLKDAVADAHTAGVINGTGNSKHDGDGAEQPAPRVVFNKTDVSDWKQLEAAFDVYEKEFGGVPYVLCPGAGVYEPVRSLFFFVCFFLSSSCPVVSFPSWARSVGLCLWLGSA